MNRNERSRVGSRWVAPIVALLAVCAFATPASASTVQIQDDSHVLNVTAVQNDAATLPVGVYVWATTQDAGSNGTFDTDVKNKVSATYPIVIGINTQSHHSSVQIGARSGLSQSSAVSAASNANSSFVGSMRSNHDYTAATNAALGSLHTSLTSARHAPRSASRGGGFAGLLLLLLFLGGIVALVAFALRRVGRPRRRYFPGPPPGYGGPGYGGPGYGGPGYGGYGYGPPRSGMGRGAAGALGALGGGLLGYELGKHEGEHEQFRHDEMMMERDRYDGGFGGPDQGNWVVGQDGDFGDAGGGPGWDPGGGDNFGGGGGDW